MADRVPKVSIKIPKENELKSALVSATGVLVSVHKSPDDALGELFSDVQKSQIFADGMTFIDLIPRGKPKQIRKAYDISKNAPDFNLRAFVDRYFYTINHDDGKVYETNLKHTPRQHIRELWNVLEKRNRLDRGSLIALPYPYIVPGGRFKAQFYWDSYFTMLGLAADDRWDMVENMIRNFTYEIRKFGFVPTANRTYYLSRSQPPFLSHMVRLLSRHKNRKLTLIEHLPYLLSEYRYWMKGKDALQELDEAAASKRVVRMPDGTMLNRYYDDKKTPRPESLREDVETASESGKKDSGKVYLDLRAAAESGWDFSSRWFREPSEIGTIHTTDIVPVDLNCLMYHLEMTIAEIYQIIFQPLLARKYKRRAEARKAAITKYMWDEKAGFFVDYDFRTDNTTPRLTLAGVFPLFTGIATRDQATKVAAKLDKDFLKRGGLVTTLVETGQQWDSPNGWAPLQWVAIQGLREYGLHELADRVKRAWVDTCLGVYKERQKMVEKYNVIDVGKLSEGGEYMLQDGFGWTNGVLSALLAEDTSD